MRLVDRARHRRRRVLGARDEAGSPGEMRAALRVAACRPCLGEAQVGRRAPPPSIGCPECSGVSLTEGDPGVGVRAATAGDTQKGPDPRRDPAQHRPRPRSPGSGASGESCTQNLNS
jgi:hypothetical protein